MENQLQIARKFDQADELYMYRGHFLCPRREDGSRKIYLCGHSLGLQPVTARGTVNAEMQAWAERGVAGHFSGEPSWMEGMEQLRAPLARLTGARPDEVVVMNTLTVNLHLMLVSFFRPVGRRRKILIEGNAFPSDRYAVASQLRFHGLDPAECLVEIPSTGAGLLLDEAEIESVIREQGDEIALVLWPGVQYASGQVFDVQRIAAASHAAGALVGLDLAHSVGNVPLALHDSGCDFAAWCNYKYLNGGPGAVGACFIHERHHGSNELPRFEGWWGNSEDKRFLMEQSFVAAEGAEAWSLSNPPVLAAAPLRASLEIFEQAGLERLRRKSMAMSEWLQSLLEQQLEDTVELLSPSAVQQRGCQLSLRLRHGRDSGRCLHDYLADQGIITDWREPDIIRAAPVPLYNSFEDCYHLVRHIRSWADQHHGEC